MSVITLQPGASARAPRRRKPRRTAAPYALVAPFFAMFSLFFLLPIGYAVWDSLHRRLRRGKGLTAKPHVSFAGLFNYRKVWHDDAFVRGLVRVILFGLVQVPVMLGLALLMAMALDSGLVRFRGWIRTTIILPYAVPGVLAALIWGFLYSPGLSPITETLSHTFAGPVNFLSKPMILWSMGNMITWSWAGYNMLIIFAALQAIPPNLVEAARVDGANDWRIATRIKLPLVVPAIILSGVFSVIGTLQIFTEPLVLRVRTTSIDSNFTPNLMAYTAAFTTNDTYYAAAISVTLALITFVLSFSLLRLTWRRAMEGQA